MMKKSILIFVLVISLAACKNKEIETRKKEIATYIAEVEKFYVKLDNINDTFALEALRKMKMLEKDFKNTSSNFVDSLSNGNIYNLRNHAELKVSFTSAVNKRIAFLKKLIDKKYEYQLKSMVKAKYHLDKTEEALKEMKPFDYDALRAMQDDTRRQHEENLKQYHARMAEFEAEKAKALEELKKEEEVLTNPEKLLTMF